jgi:hypothetical protein
VDDLAVVKVEMEDAEPRPHDARMIQQLNGL